MPETWWPAKRTMKRERVPEPTCRANDGLDAVVLQGHEPWNR